MQFLTKYRKRLLKNKIVRNKQLKIIIGAANTKYHGWISTNVSQLDITNEEDFEYYFKPNLIDCLLLEHVVEHIDYDSFFNFLKISKRYLRYRGTIRIAVPDANHPSQYVRELTGINGTEPGADDHKFFYVVDDFEKIAFELGYTIDKLEYFDKNGQFKTSNYDFNNGYISRCSRNYQGRFTDSKEEYDIMINSVPVNLRNQFIKQNISYTSLLVDFINDKK